LDGAYLGIGSVDQYVPCFTVETVIESLPVALAWIDTCWGTTDVDVQIQNNARSSLIDQYAALQHTGIYPLLSVYGQPMPRLAFTG
jgi:hypothetical protein